MDMRWQFLIGLLLVGAACAAEAEAEEDDVPDAGVDGDDSLALNQEETRNLRPRAYTPTAAFPNALPSGFRPTPSLAELAGYQQRQQQQQQQQEQQEAYLVPARPTPQQVYLEEQRQPNRGPPQRKQVGYQQKQLRQHQQQQQEQQQQQQERQQRQQEQQQQQQDQREQVYLVPVRPTPQQVYLEEQTQPNRGPPHRKPQEHQRPSKLQQQQLQEVEDELEEEKEEPDRLSQLLQQSKFDCVGKNTGYYADTELNCEVFHYCQDSVKHSWICPDGFTFHQVHLICMPPTHDSICQKSAKYHFVNEYLYRPINEEEVQRKPNVSLKYSDRFYPAEVYRDDRYDQEEEEEEEEPPRRQPQPQPQQARPAPRPQQPQVFHSAEEVNIPLGQRRPQRPYDFDF